MAIKTGTLKATTNKNRKSNEAAIYYPVYLETEDGKSSWYFFTEYQLGVAVKRAERNPEDIPVVEENGSLLGRIFGWLRK